MKILIAEDNLLYRMALQATLTEWGYEVAAVGDGLAAYEILQRPDAPKLAILDWMMPGLEGVEVCRKVRALRKPEPPYLIVLTSKDGKENIVTALESGADDHIIKPFNREELKARLRVGLRIVGLQTSQTVVFAFARAVEAKSPYTQGHADRVSRYSLALADRIGLADNEKDVLQRGAILHDIGKIAVPDAILNKPGPLTPEEFDIAKQHPVEGVKIVSQLESVREVIPLIRWHHERLDGSGYPDGLKGDAIPLLVRILSVADVYDALASARPYRGVLPHNVCLEILQKNAAGGEFDAALVKAFSELPPWDAPVVGTPGNSMPTGVAPTEAAATEAAASCSAMGRLS
jgi:putative two-component system response regulator